MAATSGKAGRFHGITPAPGVADRDLAGSILRIILARTFGTFSRARVFREGAENCARGGRAPFSISESGLNKQSGLHFK